MTTETFDPVAQRTGPVIRDRHRAFEASGVGAKKSKAPTGLSLGEAGTRIRCALVREPLYCHLDGRICKTICKIRYMVGVIPPPWGSRYDPG
jgi:hypothetical protein